MRELQLTVRYYLFGEYENTCTKYIEIPDDTPEDKEMEIMMTELRVEMEDEFGDYEEWINGDFSYTLVDWEVF